MLFGRAGRSCEHSVLIGIQMPPGLHANLKFVSGRLGYCVGLSSSE
jgi:hypothetical protein